MLVPAQRIVVYGVTGSGKSTAALRIGDRLGLPVTLIDELTWLPGWVARPVEEQRDAVATVAAGERWVIDSLYGSMLGLVLPRAELIVGLDYPRALSLWRLVRRTARRAATGEPACNGNRETWRRALGRDSIIRWHFRSWKRKRVRMRAWAHDPAMPPVLLFERPGQLDAWIAALPSGLPERPR